MSNLQKTSTNRSLSNFIIISCLYIFSISALIFIIGFLYIIIARGIGYINFTFLTGLAEEINPGGGVGPFLFNSFYVTFLSMVISLPISFLAGIYLAEYASLNRINNLARTGLEVLASVPSIVLGLFGIAIFVTSLHIGLTIIGGAVTLAIINMPVLTKVIEDSCRDIPQPLKHSAFALGATKFQVLFKIIVPNAITRIITGVSLVSGRALGESAVILLVGGTSASDSMWNFNLFAPGATLSVHLWYLLSASIVPDAAQIASGSAVVLIFVVLLINFILKIPIWLIERKK